MSESSQDRIASIEARAMTENDVIGHGTSAAAATQFTSDIRGRTVYADLFSVSFGLLLGAAAVLAGQVIEFRFLVEPDQAMNTEGFGSTVMIALGLSFLADRIVRGGLLWQGAITSGFILMSWFEMELAKMFPTLWGRLYDNPTTIANWIATYG
ncbi:MAG: hypothetical protein AAF919_18275 [Pseudomonadota bacterium]